VSLAVTDQAYAFARVAEAGSVVIAFNNGTSAVEMDLPAAPARLADGAHLEDRLGGALPVRVERGRLRVSLPPRATVVYSGAFPDR
jgi:hypothetical protein